MIQDTNTIKDVDYSYCGGGEFEYQKCNVHKCPSKCNTNITIHGHNFNLTVILISFIPTTFFQMCILLGGAQPVIPPNFYVKLN